MEHPEVWPDAAAKQETFKSDVIGAVKEAIAAHRVVVVSLAWNTHNKRAAAALDGAGIPWHYHEIGNYTNRWRDRLAVKIWAQWPTFPQVYVEGRLVGGADETIAAIAAGKLSK